MRSVEKKGRTVEEAVSAALKELGVEAERVDVQVLEEPRRGFLGIGGREARVKVTVRPRRDEAGVEFLTRLVGALGAQGRVEAREEDGQLWLEMWGEELGMLIGHHGRTLEALEYLVNLVLARSCGGREHVVVDVEGYRRRRDDAVRRMARRVAERVRRTGRSAVLEPMSARERKLVHLALQDDADIVTKSEGQEPFRKIVISKSH